MNMVARRLNYWVGQEWQAQFRAAAFPWCAEFAAYAEYVSKKVTLLASIDKVLHRRRQRPPPAA